MQNFELWPLGTRLKNVMHVVFRQPHVEPNDVVSCVVANQQTQTYST